MRGLKRKIAMKGKHNAKMAQEKGAGSKKEEAKSHKVVTIDNYNERFYRYDSGSIAPIEKLSYSGNALSAAFIANRDMIIAPVELSRGIPEESIDGALEDKAYEELGLDPAVEYTIKYIELHNEEGDNRLYQLFIIEENKYQELFSNLRESIKYVDLITPAPLLYKTLYENEILESKSVHCFLYFTSYDATIVFYKNGEYLYSKSFNYSLTHIYERYCELVGKTVDEKEFMQIFQKEGVKTSHLEYQQNFIKLFNEIFITVNDIVIYTKRAYKIDVIDQMYIGSEIGPISGVEEYAQNYLGLYATPMVFDYKISSSDWYVDQLHYMLALTTLEYVEKQSDAINFTKYPRPPVFYKRPSGQFTITIAVAILLASAYPIYYLGYSYMNEMIIYKKRKDEIPLSKEVRKYKLILSSKKREINELGNVLSQRKNTYNSKEKTLVQVYRKKVFYRLQSNQLASFSGDFEKYGVEVNRIVSENSNYSFYLLAEEDQKITSMIKGLSKKYDKELKSIGIDDIYKDENDSTYRGVLKVELK